MTDVKKFVANLDCEQHHFALGAHTLTSFTLADVNLMTYDFYGPWSSTTGAHSALYTCNAKSYSSDQSVRDWISWVGGESLSALSQYGADRILDSFYRVFPLARS